MLQLFYIVQACVCQFYIKQMCVCMYGRLELFI